MKKRLRKKLKKLGKLEQKEKKRPFRQKFLGESGIIRGYSDLRSLDGDNKLLEQGMIDSEGHFHFDYCFYRINEDVPRAVIRYIRNLHSEIIRLSPPRKNILEQIQGELEERRAAFNPPHYWPPKDE